MINVMIIDDSASVRKVLQDILESDPQINVCATAPDPIYAVKKLQDTVPDVITLDIEMPRMDGLTFLEKIMKQHPIPVVICSSMAVKGSNNALRAIELGAIEIIEKPKIGKSEFFNESKTIICDIVKAASQVQVNKVKKIRKIYSNAPPQKKLTADEVISQRKKRVIETTDKIIAIGASTGGTEAVRYFLEAMPIDAPGIVIVQHMPENFTKSFAERLNESCSINVKEAKNNDSIIQGTALIAPGGFHMLLKRSGARYYVDIKAGPLVSRHRPSVDVLFRSTSIYAGKNAVGVILTGMGDDGAKGMLEMSERGSWNFAQDEATSVVFGMPKEAIKKGGVNKVLPLNAMPNAVIRKCNE